MNTESDRAYYQRALTRIFRLAERTDLDEAERLRQIRDQAVEALERPSGDGEVIDQLKALIRDYKSKEIDVVVAEKEVGIAKAQLAASERVRQELKAQITASDLTPGKLVAYTRLEDLGCALIESFGNADSLARASRALTALAKRRGHEVDDEERVRRGRGTLRELEEQAGG
jgi:hypothetical protein